MALEIATELDQVQVPAGTITVSPSEAEATAAVTADELQLAALMVAPDASANQPIRQTTTVEMTIFFTLPSLDPSCAGYHTTDSPIAEQTHCQDTAMS